MSEPAATWDNVLRGLVDEAFEVRGTSTFLAATEAIVTAFIRWPLVEFHLAKRAADRDLEQHAAQRASALEILCDTNHLVSSALEEQHAA
jgi:hypothetical protein